MVVLVADEDALAGAPHAVDIVMLFEALETREDGGVFFWLRLLGAECVIGEGEESDCLGLVAVEGFGKNGWVGCLQGGGCYGRHSWVGGVVSWGREMLLTSQPREPASLPE